MIDYGIIDRSIQYYEDRGFKRIESPWTVTSAITNLTMPDGKAALSIAGKDKDLVGSGEQSFLYLYLKGFLPNGKFQTITPCFRNDIFDQTHTKYFIKNELIDTETVTQARLVEVVDTAFFFFDTYLPGCKIVKTDQGYDIEYAGYELGSYGIRSCSFLKWIYATGVAEPRLSNIIKMNQYK